MNNFVKYLLIISILLTPLQVTATEYSENEQVTKTIQLTDYRYDNIENGLYGFSFCNTQQETKNFYNSVILKDGTELFPQGKYGVPYEIGTDPFFEFQFPQYENLFSIKLCNDNNDKWVLLDNKGNALTEWDDGGHSLFINENLLLTGSFYFTKGFCGDENFGEIQGCPTIVNLKNLKMIKNEHKMTYHYISTSKDNDYFWFPGEKYEYVSDSMSSHNPPKGYDFYYDSEGNEITRPEDVEFDIIKYSMDYLGYTSESGITTNKIDKSYLKKEKNIGGKTYYALFKKFDENESYDAFVSEDDPSDWAKSSIEKATSAGLLYNNANCRYKDNISRQDFCILIVEAYCKALGIDIDEYINQNNVNLNFDKFEDTDNAYILLANELGFVNGTSKTTFSPLKGITRQEAAVMLDNTAKLLGLSPNSERVNFSDSSYFANWAADAIYSISSIKTPDGTAIMGGTEPEKFSPWMTYTREQAYTTICRLYETAKKK